MVQRILALNAPIQTSTTAEDERITPASAVGLRVLLAEDNSINAILARALLEREGCHVECAVNGFEGDQRGALGRPRPDPDGRGACRRWDGIQASKILRSEGYRGAIVALTADAFEDDRKACMAVGMDDFLTKPLEAGALKAMLGKWGPIGSGRRRPRKTSSSPDLALPGAARSPMTAAPDAAPNPAAPARRGILRTLSEPRLVAMLLLGFSSGLPFFLTANVLGFWLRDEGTSLTAIGFLAWVGFAYSFKFLWSPPDRPAGRAAVRAPVRPPARMDADGAAAGGGGAGGHGDHHAQGGPGPHRRRRAGGRLRLGHPGHRDRRLAHRERRDQRGPRAADQQLPARLPHRRAGVGRLDPDRGQPLRLAPCPTG
ncbi:MAG: response regulator [Caulobacteraceae bacterium]